MIDDTLISNTPDLLGILDEKYDRLFSIIDKDRSSLYVLEIEGKTYYNMEKEPRYDGIKYTWNGLIRNTIFFRKFVFDHYEKIEVCPQNMPSAIWSSDVFGNKVKLLFRIPNGGKVKIDYPDQSFIAPCEYIDDYHTWIGGEVYHICQFAEILEQGGGKVSPEPEIDVYKRQASNHSEQTCRRPGGG